MLAEKLRNSCEKVNPQLFRITKFIGMTYDLSHLCRWRLTNLLCSSCDGDIVTEISCRDKIFAKEFAITIAINYFKIVRMIISHLTPIISWKYAGKTTLFAPGSATLLRRKGVNLLANSLIRELINKIAGMERSARD